MKQRYQRPFYIIIVIAYFALFISVMGAMLMLGGCSNEYQVLEIEPDIISYSNNLIKLNPDSIVVLDNGMGHYDKWWIKEGVTFEIIVHESEDWVRIWPDSDFVVSSDRAYTVGEGKDHLLDFTALNPPVALYYFTIETIINGYSTTHGYVIDSN